MGSKNIITAANIIVFSTFIITSAVMFYIGQLHIGIELLLSMAIYVLFTKIENLEEELKGGTNGKMS